jgi:recombination protein RecT
MSNIIKANEIEQLLAPKKSDFVALLNGKPEIFTREISFAVQAINGSEMLQKCDRNSVLQAVYNIALTGLSLNPISKLAYLTPRWNAKKQQNECLLMPSYQGMVKVITDTGSAKKLDAFLIMEGDVFEVSYGTESTIIHKPKFPKGKTIIGAYAIAVLSNGEKQFEVMDKDELDHVRACSDSWKAFESGKAKSSIWNDWEGEMCRKTVIKRLTKYLPKNKEFEAVGKVIELDNQDYPAADWQYIKAESLLQTSTFDAEQRANFDRQLEQELTGSEIGNIIFQLEQNQLDAISAGFNASAKDIKEKINENLSIESK